MTTLDHRTTPLDLAAAQQPTVSIPDLRRAGEQLHQALEREVSRLRLQGASWAELARALKVTKQSAWERWRYLDEAPVALVLIDAGPMLRSTVTGVLVDVVEASPAVLVRGLAALRQTAAIA